MVGLTYREIHDKLRQHNIPFHLTLEDIKRETKEISSNKKKEILTFSLLAMA